LINFVGSCLRGKWPVVLSATILLLGLALGTQITGSVAGAWRLMGVPSMTPSFADTSLLTHAIECLQSGHDPYMDKTCDPWGRPYNYPPVWLELSRLSVGPATTKIIGVVIAASTFAAATAILSSGSPVSGALILLTLLSPPILFGIERGNVDLLVFTLLVVGIAATSAAPPRVRTASQALLIIALTVLKIYPVVAASIFLRNGRGWFLSILVAATAAGAFLWAAYGRIGPILVNTPVNYWLSFGAAPLFIHLREAWVIPGPVITSAQPALPGDIPGSGLIRWIASATALGWALVLVLGRLYFFGSRHVFERLLPTLKQGETAGDIAVACLSVFIFCFLLGSNFNYRLIFLLGAMPVMLQHFESRPAVRTLLAPTAVVTLLWLSPLYWSYLNEVVDWLVFSGAVTWLAANLLLRRRLPKTINGCA